jgi:hypothetical protein
LAAIAVTYPIFAVEYIFQTAVVGEALKLNSIVPQQQ